MSFVDIILLGFGAIILMAALESRRVPKGLLEWAIWVADIVIIVNWTVRR